MAGENGSMAEGCRRYVDFQDRFVNGRIWIFNQNTYHAGSSPVTAS